MTWFQRYVPAWNILWTLGIWVPCTIFFNSPQPSYINYNIRIYREISANILTNGVWYEKTDQIIVCDP